MKMNTADLETYEGQLARLDREYIRRRALCVDLALEQDGCPVSLVYEPGNGTRYDLVFVPIAGIDHLDPWRIIPEGTLRPNVELGDNRWTLVVKCNGAGSSTDFAYPFNLVEGHVAHYGYVEEHTPLNFADACAVSALLNAIAGTRD